MWKCISHRDLWISLRRYTDDEESEGEKESEETGQDWQEKQLALEKYILCFEGEKPSCLKN